MGRNSLSLGDFEELVLLAIQNLGSDAYGVPIRELLEERTQRRVTVGALYTTLSRLEDKGYISSRKGEITPERGGRPRMYFQIEAPGHLALSQAERDRLSLKKVRLGLAGG
jgi:DNA-binding PadR family transcriptional regulator